MSNLSGEVRERFRQDIERIASDVVLVQRHLGDESPIYGELGRLCTDASQLLASLGVRLGAFSSWDSKMLKAVIGRNWEEAERLLDVRENVLKG